jgi:hypothetical protein
MHNSYFCAKIDLCRKYEGKYFFADDNNNFVEKINDKNR